MIPYHILNLACITLPVIGLFVFVNLILDYFSLYRFIIDYNCY